MREYKNIMPGKPRSQRTSQRMDLRLRGRTPQPSPGGSPNPKPQTGTGATPGWGIGIGTTLTGIGEKLTRMSLAAKNPYGFPSWNEYYQHLQNTPWSQEQIDYIDKIERKMRSHGYGNGWPGQVSSGPHLGQLVPANGAPLRSFKPGQTIRFGHGHSFRLPYSENVRVPISTKWGVYHGPKAFGSRRRSTNAGVARHVGGASIGIGAGTSFTGRGSAPYGSSGGGSSPANSGVDPNTGVPKGWGESTGGGSEGGGGGSEGGGGTGRGGGGGESGGGGGSADIGGFGTEGHMVAEHYLGGGQSNPAVSMRTIYHS